MGRLLNEIMEDLICVFQLIDINNLQIKKQINKGFSGAEVYLIELTGESTYKGIYFLKIDTEDKEYRKAKEGYCFPNAASIVRSERIHDYFVMLLEIAGESLISYAAFYDIDELSLRRKAAKKIVPDLLENAIKNKKYIGKEMDASEVFASQLFSKLDSGNVLAKFVTRMIRSEKVNKVMGVTFDKGICLPNAYAFAINNSLWKGRKIRSSNCCIHGDFHGDNVFYSIEKSEYAMIDLALYRKDGYIFYDIAYFELSLLLHTSSSMEMMRWILLIRNFAQKHWEDVNCIDKAVFQDIIEAEDTWIKKKTNQFHSYTDSLLEARLVARVIAGLNYAGKKEVDKEIRKKAFLYACAYLERLLGIKGITNWKKELVEWREVEQNCKDTEIEKFCTEIDNFNDTQRYILVLGDNYNYPAEVLDALTRIHWCGIISFRRTEKIEKYLKENNILNAITVINKLDLITPENLWCIYADGIEYDPDTINDTYPKWRNRYGKFLDDLARKLDDVIAPDELQVIIDRNSFSNVYSENLNRLYESLDLIENACVNIAILDREGKYETVNEENYERISFGYYKIAVESIAEFCLKYLKGTNEEEVTIPSILGIRKVVPADDFRFIKNYVFLLHNKVLQYEGNVSEEEKRGFYYGKDVLWQAIEEKMYVEREEYQEFEEIVNKKIKERNQFLLRVIHYPGAGASVLFRIIAWRFRNNYPVVIVDSLNKNIKDCIQRLYSLSGKHILVFLEGDFSENDVTQLIQQSLYNGVKVGIVFPNRCYDDPEKKSSNPSIDNTLTSYAESENKLSILNLSDAMFFCDEYKKEMMQLKQYSQEKIEMRGKNMEQLATNRSLINYRLPFFFGINAFEEEYESIPDYMDGIMNHVVNNRHVKQIVNYIALITFYTENDGLNVFYVKKLLSLDNKISTREILKQLNGDINNFVYYSASSGFKICHSVVASKILKKQYKIASTEFKDFLEAFVHDICGCEGKRHTERLNNLLMNLFVKRDIEGDISNNLVKKNFSPIIFALNDRYLQETFFRFLSSEISDNAHFHQHYGRLIIYNNPNSLEVAKEQFDKAIDLESSNSLHYHARGQMYTKYIMNLCRNKYKNSTVQELFNATSQFAEAAIEDYETSVQLIVGKIDTPVDLSYPYASIVQTITYIVHQMYLKDSTKEEEKDFLTLNTEVSKWCGQMIRKVKQYDMDTENRYDLIRENSFYKDIRRHLIKYQYTTDDIEKKLLRAPDNLELMKEYLYTMDTKKERWEDKRQDELKRIIQYCKQIISGSKEKNEGVLWCWFNALLNYKDANVVEMIAFLGTMDVAEDNLTVQFMLYVIKLGLYIKSHDDRMLLEILEHIKRCKKINMNSNKSNTRYYYRGQMGVGFCYNQEKGEKLKGTVIKWNSPQNGYLTLDIQPRLTAFFVPSVIGMSEEGAVGSKLNLKLGVSFDGLRAWTKDV